jgi:hypothetical protein
LSRSASKRTAWSVLSGLEDDLHALILLVLEGLVCVRGVVEPKAVRDDKTRVDITVSDALVEALEVLVDVGIGRPAAAAPCS